MLQYLIGWDMEMIKWKMVVKGQVIEQVFDGELDFIVVCLNVCGYLFEFVFDFVDDGFCFEVGND